MSQLDARHKRRAGAIFALFALLASLMVGFASPASANSEVVPKGVSVGGNVFGTWNGQQRTFYAGLIGVDTDNNGSVDAYAYCIDLGTNLANNKTYTEGTWNQATVPNLGKITWILQNYDPSVPANRTEDVAKAVQAAIWHFSDGFNLDLGNQSGNNQAVRDLYSSILANAQDVPEPSPTLSIAPADQSEEAGTGLVYNVSSTAPGPVALSLGGSIPAGTKIVPAAGGVCDAGAAPITSVTLTGGNAQVCVYSDQPGGPAELTGTVSQATASGRVFLRPNAQKLIFAGGGTVSANAKAKGSWSDYSTFTIDVTCDTVTITSNGKDLSNIVWQGVTGPSEKADGLSGKTYVIPNDPANPVAEVWIKAGNNKNEGPQPRPPHNGNNGLGAYFTVAAPEGCVPDPGASAAVECVDNDGTITVTLNNTGYGEVTFDVTNPVTSEVTSKVVGAKGTDTVVFTDVPDGTYDVPVTAKVAGQPDEDLTIEGLTVSCDAPGTPEVLQDVECVDFDGTVTLTLANTGTPGKAKPIHYVVKDLGDNVVFDGPVAPGAQQVVTIDDVPDGVHVFPVTADGVDKNQTVTVDCDADGTAEVTEKVECVDFDGTVTLTLANTGTPGKAKPVHYVVKDLGGAVVYDGNVAAGDSVPVVINGVPDGEWTFPVTADGTDKSQTVTVDCDGPGTPVVEKLVECVDFDGTVTLTLKNTGIPGKAEPVAFVVENTDGSPKWEGTVAAGQQEVVTFTGVADGEHTYPVSADGEDMDQTVTVDCDAPGTPSVAGDVECIDFDGTITVTLANTGTPGKAKPVAFVVKDPVTDAVVFDGSLEAGETKIIEFDGLADGDYTVPVTANGDDESLALTVDCDGPGTPVVEKLVECVDFDGTVTLTLKNTGIPGKAEPVAFVVKNTDGSPKWEGTVAAGQQEVVTFADVADGVHAYPVSADGEDMDQTVTVDCDGPGTPVIEDSVECVDFDGTVTLTLKNTGTPGKAKPVAYVVRDLDGEIAWAGNVAPGAEHVVTFDGIADGTWTFPVLADGEPDDVTVTVDCDGPGTAQVTSAVECADNDGTVTLTLANTGTPGKAKPVAYVVRDLDGEIAWEGDVAAGDEKLVTFESVPDGTHTYPVTADGEDVDQTVTVACDAPGIPEVDSVVECTAAGGEVTIVLGNEGVDAKNLPITYRVTDPRDGTSQDVTVEPGESLEVVYDDVADGEYTFGVDVIEGDEVVESFDQTVTVLCAEPEVLGISVECAEGGVVVVLGNPGTNPTEMTVRKGDTVIATEVVAPGDEVRVLVPMEEGETATITVSDGDEVLSSQTITLDCEDPAPPTTPSTAQVAGVTQTPTAVSPTGALPYTGGDVVRTLGLGLLLAAAGFGLVLATRRRRS
ncbi:Cys-Gln thioester bond-forming surface protein [Rhabdothermincola salaria]|uniref:Cys-Gln thioester bond-forming surface protein n=1 Tax=Rhabdothermincola salaria TaxID=2903142 RepID=UPI001E4C31B4|nr:Cys-Gln thioester bond-forming surface protein [Rhabdothermincola salaria]MCD9624550.1 Cys-Gln thioester bond-forming surface protein [Rhabdothermincola salaria]